MEIGSMAFVGTLIAAGVAVTRTTWMVPVAWVVTVLGSVDRSME